MQVIIDITRHGQPKCTGVTQETPRQKKKKEM
jgi:hypothetical protein